MTRSRTRRGQVLVLFGLSLIVLVSCCGLAIDMGMLYSQRRQMQNAADSAAYGATQFLAETFRGPGYAAITDAQVFDVATHFATANTWNAARGSLMLSYLDSTGAVVATHPAAIPANARGIYVKATTTLTAMFTAVLGRTSFATGADAKAQFGTSQITSSVGVFPLAISPNIGADQSLQPFAFSGSGNSVNAAVLAPERFGGASPQTLADSLANGISASINSGTSYPIEAANSRTFNANGLVAALQARIDKGQAKRPPDTAGTFNITSPQLLIVPTTDDNFGGGTVKITGFRGYFITGFSGSGDNILITGTFVTPVLGYGSADLALGGINLPGILLTTKLIQ